MTALDPQVSELLAALSGTPPLPPWEVPIAAFRAAGERLTALAGAPDARCDVRDFGIRLPGRLLRARHYRPRGATGSLAGAVYFHGGGFVRGSLDSHDRLCRELSVRGGLAVVAVAYRLAPEHVFPHAHDDAIEAFCWVAEHADELRIERDALAVAGDSAGALLAASTAMSLQERTGGPQARAQGLLCPVLDVTLANESVARNANAPFLPRPVLEWCVDQYFPDPRDRRSVAASPSMRPSLAGAPPALIISAEIDPVSDDARQFAARLQDAGISSELHEFPGMPHSFFLMAGVLDHGDQAILTFAEKLSALLR
ncbi:MAG TPA: alpha/beta hydrolase [Kribbella sp.]